MMFPHSFLVREIAHCRYEVRAACCWAHILLHLCSAFYCRMLADERQVSASMIRFAPARSCAIQSRRTREDADARTIRYAVTSADLRVLEKGSIAWANRETGSSGNVVEIDEVTTDAGPCRRFVASRQNFEGIFLYRGEACLLADGHWRLKRFEAVGA